MENTATNSYLPAIVTLIAGLLIGFLVGAMTVDSREEMALKTNTNTEPAGSISGEVDSTLVEGNEDDVAFTIQVDSLSSEQRTMLRAVGVDGESLAITNGMVVCAEAEMGANRVVEIQNGAEITMSEGVALVGCYTSN